MDFDPLGNRFGFGSIDPLNAARAVAEGIERRVVVYGHRVEQRIERRVSSVTTWVWNAPGQALGMLKYNSVEVIAYLLPPAMARSVCFLLGEDLGLAECVFDMAKGVYQAIKLERTLILAAQYEITQAVQAHRFDARSKLAASFMAVLTAFPGGALVPMLGFNATSAEMKEAHDTVAALVAELRKLMSNPSGWWGELEKLGGQGLKDVKKWWARLSELSSSPDPHKQFEAGEMFGKAMGELLLTILLVISMVGTVFRVARLVAAGAEWAGEMAELAAAAARAQGSRLSAAIEEFLAAAREYRAARTATNLARVQETAKAMQVEGASVESVLKREVPELSKEALKLEKAPSATGSGTRAVEPGSGGESKTPRATESGSGPPVARFGKVPETVKTSSSVDIHPTPGKTTTVLGNYKADMKGIIHDQLEYPKTEDFGAKPGGYNVLNVPDDLYKTPDQFWQDYNKPFLDEAIKRGDPISLATKPTNDVLFNAKGELTGFGRELQYLEKNGFSYNPARGQMIRK